MSMPRALYTVAGIRQIEQAALRALPSRTLMQRAGRAAADHALHLLPAHAAPSVLLLAGPGNNGGDAFEMAMHLAEAGCDTSLMLVGDANTLPPDAAQALQQACTHDTVRMIAADAAHIASGNWSLVVDGLFGIGLSRPIQGDARALIEAVNTLRCPVLALDVPSGLNADTGAVLGGSAGIAVRATHTITFIGDKPGLHTGDGRDFAGDIAVRQLAIDPALFPVTDLHLNEPAQFAAALKPRLHNSHKGSYGDLIVLGGASGMVGAAVLAARTAAKCGAGRVFIASPANALAYDAMQPELMCRPAQQLDFNTAVMVCGPGLGITREAHDLLNRSIASSSPLVLDADALNLIAAEPGLQHKLPVRRAPSLMTPHPLEAARLLDTSTGAIQADRLAAARTLATRFHATVILKGSGSVIASPDGRMAINPTGNPALATAGAGDVLSGVCGALLAQRWPLDMAACAAVWLHGKAADDLVESGIGPIGVTASELILPIRAALNRLVHQQSEKFKPGVPPKS
ncbi:MAG TPA: NAD(P)H-hydrate dehydratase [Oxalicibacterium sp.]|nr:NAD(P)H-hydrate dehydratase [Oxalicibacterium sp.]